MDLKKPYLHKALVILITVIMLLTAALPYCKIFTAPNENTKGGWMYSYVWSDWILMPLVITLAVCWCLYLLLKERMIQKIVKIGMLLAAAGLLFIALEGVVFISPDYLPYYGLVLSALIFPLLIVLLLLKNLLNKEIPAAE